MTNFGQKNMAKNGQKMTQKCLHASDAYTTRRMPTRHVGCLHDTSDAYMPGGNFSPKWVSAGSLGRDKASAHEVTTQGVDCVPKCIRRVV